MKTGWISYCLFSILANCYRHYASFPHSIHKVTENEFKGEKAGVVCDSVLD